MEFSAIQIILIALWTFFVGMDQYNLTESCNQPVVNCAVIGLILGDLTTGLVIGGMYQLMTIGSMPIGGANPPNTLIGGVMGTVFAVASGLDVEAAVGLAVPFAIVAQYVGTFWDTMLYVLMPVADKCAANADPKGIARLNWIALIIQGLLYAIISVLGVMGGSALGEVMGNFASQAEWFMNGLGAAGGMMKFVGFAVLMRIMLSNDFWGIYFAGFALATIIGYIPGLGGSALLLIAFFGVALALYDYQTRVAMKSSRAGIVGGDEEGI